MFSDHWSENISATCKRNTLRCFKINNTEIGLHFYLSFLFVKEYPPPKMWFYTARMSLQISLKKFNSSYWFLLYSD